LRLLPDLGAFSAEYRATAVGRHDPAVTTCGELTCMPGIGGTDLPADVLVLPLADACI
jgi:hypothetical protein